MIDATTAHNNSTISDRRLMVGVSSGYTTNVAQPVCGWQTGEEQK
jgi:hypothetical protein